MRYLKLIVIVLIIFCCMNISQAEPTPDIRYLMNEHVSMLDWGIYRIEEALYNDISSLGHKSAKYEVAVSYDWDLNRLIIFVQVYNSKTKEQAKNWCRDTVSLVKLFFGITSSDPKFNTSTDMTLKHFFSHEGYMNKSKPSKIYRELANITKIKVWVFNDKLTKSVSCEAPLLGTKILFQE